MGPLREKTGSKLAQLELQLEEYKKATKANEHARIGNVSGPVPSTLVSGGGVTRGIALAVGDAAAVFVCVFAGLLVAILTRAKLGLIVPPGMTNPENIQFMLLTPLLVVLWFSHTWGHYTRLQPFWVEAKSIVKLVLYAAAVVLAVTFLTKNHLSRIWFLTTYVSFVFLVPLARYSMKSALYRLGLMCTPIALIGNPDQFSNIRKIFDKDFTLGYKVETQVSLNKPQHMLHAEFEAELVERCLDLARNKSVTHLLVAPSSGEELENYSELQAVMYQEFNNILFAKEIHGMSQANAELLTLSKNDMMFVRLNSNLNRSTFTLLKRLFDVVLSALAVVILSPILLLLWLAVASDGGRALYASKRVGRSGVLFDCYKFRSMRLDADNYLNEIISKDPELRKEWLANFKLNNDPRITWVGKILRKTSLDELPQLFNVLKGDMSLVGPRPILLDEVERYGNQIFDYQSLRPGITGMWQVSGRNSVTYGQRIELNKWYARNWTLWLDLTILIKTIPVVFSRQEAG